MFKHNLTMENWSRERMSVERPTLKSQRDEVDWTGKEAIKMERSRYLRMKLTGQGLLLHLWVLQMEGS